MSWFCKHDWYVIKDELIEGSTEVPSSNEDLEQFDGDADAITQYLDNGKDTQHTILKCNRCGKIRETIFKV